MTWNYRIIRHKGEVSEWLAIHEVFYDDEGNPDGCTENPIHIIGDDLEEIEKTLEYMQLALNKPIIDYQYFEDLENNR